VVKSDQSAITSFLLNNHLFCITNFMPKFIDYFSDNIQNVEFRSCLGFIECDPPWWRSEEEFFISQTVTRHGVTEDQNYYCFSYNKRQIKHFFSSKFFFLQHNFLVFIWSFVRFFVQINKKKVPLFSFTIFF